MSYFVTFLYFDTKHQRSNKFSHLSIAILEGKKEDSQIVDMRLLSSYGYYSHRIPSKAQISVLESLLSNLFHVTFRTNGYYAYFKTEKLINIDMGFGIDGGPIIEITEEEKKQLEENIQFILQNQKNFFAEADRSARKIVDKMPFIDEKDRKNKLSEMKAFFREKHYQNELDHIDEYIQNNKLDLDLLTEEVAYESGLISARRLQEEKLKAAKNIDMFEFSFNPQGRTCKTMGIELVMKSLADNDCGGVRKLFLSDILMGSYYASAIPRWTKGISKMIFNSVQDEYSSTSGAPPFPVRTWDNHKSCKLVAFDQNSYIDLEGNTHTLKNIDRKKQFMTLLENFMHLKRLLNDFCDKHKDYQVFIRCIDQAIAEMNICSDDFRQVVDVYKAVIVNLDKIGCFDRICNDILGTNKSLESLGNIKTFIKRNHIKLEDSIAVELERLKIIRKHIVSSSLVDELLRKPKSFFQFFSCEKTNTPQVQDPNMIELDEIKYYR